MNKFIDITDRKKLNECLSKLLPGTVPVWGSSAPLKMVTHLVESVEYTNGKKQTECTASKDEMERGKQYIIYSDAAIPMGIQTPGGKEGEEPVIFENLQTAIEALNKELDAFELYFQTPGAVSVHPGFGELNYKEWLVFHGKHFTHHLKQFGLWE